MLIVVSLLLPVILQAQVKISGTTSKLPPGTYLKDGRIFISEGYRVEYSGDSTTISLIKINDSGGLTGTKHFFKCACWKPRVIADSVVSIKEGEITCKTKEGKCKECIGVTIYTLARNINHISRDSNLVWKRIVLPVKKN